MQKRKEERMKLRVVLEKILGIYSRLACLCDKFEYSQNNIFYINEKKKLFF